MIAGYLTLAEAARRSSLSLRTLRRALRDVRRPLGHLRVGRRVVISERDLSSWLEGHRATPRPLSAAVLDRVSPAARELLGGLFGTSGAPHGRKSASSQAGPADAVNAAHDRGPA